MRILLIKPYPELPVSRRLQEGFLHLEPLELETVAGGVPEDTPVKILDLSVEKSPLTVFSEVLRQWQPDITGFSGYSSQLEIIKKLAETAKRIKPDTITVVGGIHATLLPKDYAVPDIDIIVRGEGGTAFREIVRRYKDRPPLFFDNRALSPHDPEFSQKALSDPPAYPKPEEIPLPRRDLVDRSRYFCVWTASATHRLKTMFPRVATIRTSIGCAFSCSFCVIPYLMRGTYLLRSPHDVVQEIAALQEDHIYCVDDEMFLNVEHARGIAELLLARGIHKRFTSWARSDTIVRHPELFRLWKKAGLDTLYVGLESMDASRLAEYKKRIPVAVNRRAIGLLRDIGITLHAAFIVHPDFSIADFQCLNREVASLCPAEVSFTVLSPSPATPFWKEQAARFICDPYRFYDCMHTLVPTRLPLKTFYRQFARLTETALRRNPLRIHKIKVPPRDIFRAIYQGTRYIVALRNIYRDYEEN